MATLILEIYKGDTTYRMNGQDLKAKIEFEKRVYEMSIQEISFLKKMYSPGEIVADVQFKLENGSEWVKIKKSDLEKTFTNLKVNLKYGSKKTDGTTVDEKGDTKPKMVIEADTVCSGYYISSLEPRYKPDSMFVTLRMYSPDKVMTLQKGCRSFVAQRLCRDILNSRVNRFPLPYDSNSNLEYDYEDLRYLSVKGDSKEAIFPYLVQYNESFYDFLVRTTNRWGEFLYYEDGKLHIGCKYNPNASKSDTPAPGTTDDDKDNTPKDNSPKNDVANIDKWDTLTYYEQSAKDNSLVNSVNNVDTDVVYDEHMLNNPIEKGKYAELLGVMGCDLDHGGGPWTTKIIGNLLSSGKNLMDFIVDTAVDEGIALAQAQKKRDKDNAKIDKEYFTTDKLSDKQKAQYNTALNQYNLYADITPHLTATLYKQVLTGEIHASQNMVCIEFDTTYKHFPLGQIITIGGDSDKYIVVESGARNEKVQAWKKTTNVEKKDTEIDSYDLVSKVTTVYYLRAIKIDDVDSKFYPTIHPAGHIRQSGAQHAVITTDADPTRQGRVRVKFPWQVTGDDDTPYIVFARPAGRKNAGTFVKHYEGELVLVEFANGNVERPYVVGSLSMGDQKVPAKTYKNDFVHMTPGGQTIMMSDGGKSDAGALLAAFSSGYKMMQGFWPETFSFNTKLDDSFEGNVEICDKYGFYSIKGSTDGRNVTIKSPFGDVKLSAFTGISISAPNGDVKIQGKNVTIEAGNNLTLTSGKNIKDKFLASDYGAGGFWANFGVQVAASIAKKIGSMVGGFLDISYIRSIVEVFYRPVEGKMQLKSNRYLALEAGKGKTAYPVDAYNHPNKHLGAKNLFKNAVPNKDRKKLFDSFESVKRDFAAVPQIVNPQIESFVFNYRQARASLTSLKNRIARNTVANALPCKLWTLMLDELWSNPSQSVDNVISFQGKLNKTEQKMETVEFIKLFFPAYNAITGSDEYKSAYKKKAARKYAEERKGIKDDVQAIANAIMFMNNLPEHLLVDGRNDLSDKAKSALKAVNFPDDIKKTTDNVKYFVVDLTENDLGHIQKKLRRACFIALVNALEIPREPVADPGQPLAPGQQAPDAPDPYGDNIDQAWEKYANSIQHLYPEPKNPLLTAVVSNLDPLSSWTGLIDDIADRHAFGSSKKGEILFSNGCTTQILGPQIEPANVKESDVPDYVDSKSQAYAASLRELMMQ